MRHLISLSVAIVAPFIIMAVYLYASRLVDLSYATWDYLVLAVSVLIGALSLSFLGVRWAIRIPVIVAYIIGICIGLVYFALYVVGVFFNDWL